MREGPLNAYSLAPCKACELGSQVGLGHCMLVAARGILHPADLDMADLVALVWKLNDGSRWCWGDKMLHILSYPPPVPATAQHAQVCAPRVGVYTHIHYSYMFTRWLDDYQKPAEGKFAPSLACGTGEFLASLQGLVKGL